jgi:chromate transporter
MPHAPAAITQSEPTPVRVPTFLEALAFWGKLGLVSFGGPAGQIAIMHRELVETRRWISEERFLHALNFCMLLPGPEAQQLATYIGWLQHGVRGGITAGVLFVLPGFVLITVISVAYARFHSLPAVTGLLFGLKAAVLAVVLEAVLRVGRRALRSRLSWYVAALAFIGLFALALPFPLIIVGAATLGLIVHRVRPAWLHLPASAEDELLHDPRRGRSRLGYALRVIGVCSVLWLAPIVLIAITLGRSHVLTTEAVFFSKMAVVTFGGAYAVLAYVAQEAVTHFHWLSPADMLQGLALAETTPGPLILVLTFVGFMGAFDAASPFCPLLAGLLGAALTTWVTFVPCFLWIFLGAPYVERLRHQRALSAALATVTAAVVGVILNLAVWFGLHALFADVTTWRGAGLIVPVPRLASIDLVATALAVGAMVSLLRFKVPLLAVLAASALIGVAIQTVR